MKKTYKKPEIEIYNISKKDEVIVTSGNAPTTTYGLGWFVLPDEDEEFKD